MPEEEVTTAQKVDERPAKAVAAARTAIGKPYVFGATGPNSFDCSGLIVWAYKQAGLSGLPHWTGALIAVGKEVAQSDLMIGDMVFPDSGHVQLYSGNGNIIEAPQPGEKVAERPMWGFWRARRVVNQGSSVGVEDALEIALEKFRDLTGISAVERSADAAGDALRLSGTVLSNIANPKFWARLGQGALAAMLILTGIVWLNRRTIVAGAGAIVRGAGTLGESFVGGAAFGLGAGRTGGSAAPGAPGPGGRVPRAPAPANRGYAAPVTAVLPRSPAKGTAVVARAPIGSTRPRKRPLTGSYDPNAKPVSHRPKAVAQRTSKQGIQPMPTGYPIGKDIQK